MSEAPGFQHQLVSAKGVLAQTCKGYAEVLAKKTVTLETQFLVYSVTKVITAIATLQLCESGELSLDFPIARALPDFELDPEITVRHLLSQSSGLSNPLPTRWVHLPNEHAEFDERQRLRSILERHRKLRFKPGTRYGYSNLSYWILAQAIEALSGHKFSGHVTSRIFLPLGITSRAAFVLNSQLTYASGYLSRWSAMNLIKSFVADSKFWSTYEGKWLRIEPHCVDGPGFGGLITDSSTLGVLISDLLGSESKILRPESVKLLFEPQFTKSGKSLPMTLGFHIDSLDGVPYLFKEGGGMGFHAEIRIYPKQGVGSVLLMNDGAAETRKTLTRFDREHLARLRPGTDEAKKNCEKVFRTL